MADPELTSWCNRNGIEFNGIVAEYVSEGWRGIVATKDLQPGEVVLRVPERLLMTTRSAARDPQLAASMQRHQARTAPAAGSGAAGAAVGSCGLSPFQALACHLLLEVSRGPDSFWWPYLKQLPRSYTSLANFGPDDAAALQLQHARDAAVAAADRAREEWRGALPVLHELGLPKRFTSFRAWLWAASSLHSRTMYLPWCPAGALTPYGDLHNYQPPPAPYTPQLGGPAAVAAGRADAAAASPCGSRAAGGKPVIAHARTTAAAAAGKGGEVEMIAAALPGPLEPLPTATEEDSEQRGAARSPVAPGAAVGGGRADTCCGGGGGGSVGRRDVDVDVGGRGGCPGDDSAAPATCAGDGSRSPSPGPGRRPPGPDSSGNGPCGPACAAMAPTRDCYSHHGDATRRNSLSTDCARASRSSADSCEGRELRGIKDGGRCGGGGGSDASDGHGAGRRGGAMGTAEDGSSPEPQPPAAGDSGGAASTDAAQTDDGSTIAGDGMWDEPAQQYCIVVRRPYRRGEQVMLCYGRYTNLELLEHYGFVLQDNPHDTAQLDPAALPLPSSARAAAGAPYLAPSDCFLHANGQPSWQLLHLLRYCAASPAERRSAGHLMAAGERVSEQGDRQVLRWLHAACSRQLGDLSNSPHLQQQQQQQPEQQQQRQKQPQSHLHQGAGSETQGQRQGQDTDEAHARAAGEAAVVSQRRQAGTVCGEAAAGGPESVDCSSPLPTEPCCSTGETSSEVVTVAAPGSAPEPASGAAAASGGGAETAAAGAAATALSDGLTCAGLAVQWRVQQQQILLRAMRCAEEVLGSDAVAAAGPSGRGRVMPRDLGALMQQQRQRRTETTS
ncbi:hypothetical protein PLESTB_001526700 [Pleodorina starrii]|uniref:Uncharacterized protein n=1 Tax=Pleodorina starrii TaxID=330485 RepID=A0A9W6BWW8_9CHLO|nr:hypothetical protein PLESTM_001167100 [Pleodorina starrii]GLC59723.1 hypothetical protein PLESTB_001526700 [Pleodorina starrii]GLC75355.1 hypothetical protein PLESTF_001627200 [Pleodorina starrii]